MDKRHANSAEQIAKIQSIDLATVHSVYSGKPGCCCGCRGKHSYAAAHRLESSKQRGYEVRDNEVNDRQVKKVVNLLKANAADVQIEDDFLALETETRLYVVYFGTK